MVEGESAVPCRAKAAYIAAMSVVGSMLGRKPAPRQGLLSGEELGRLSLRGMEEPKSSLLGTFQTCWAQSTTSSSASPRHEGVAGTAQPEIHHTVQGTGGF